ncbi:MAG: carboxypeptidase regulatory-like domain-containing protein [Sphingobacteriales bacterium]|nr:MAG: carboxypeptidase regulatory-like domain-containing protein [Sphingobacteriales bacterium]
MKAFSIFIALLLAATASFAQKIGGISGKITDEHGQAVPDAIVTVLDSNLTVASSITNTDGTYLVRPIKPGNYTIRITERFHEVKMLYNFPVYKNKFTVLDMALVQPGIASREVIKMVKGGVMYSYEIDSSGQ